MGNIDHLNETFITNIRLTFSEELYGHTYLHGLIVFIPIILYL